MKLVWSQPLFACKDHQINIPALPKRLALSAAISTALLTGYGGRKTYAACINTGAGAYGCSGVNISPQVLNPGFSGDITITTTPGFSVNAPANNGLTITSTTATDDLSFVDNNYSAITGKEIGFYIDHHGSGALTVTTSGAISSSGNLFDGVRAYNRAAGTDLVLNLNGDINGSRTGVATRNFGTGDLNIVTGGGVTGVLSDGIKAINYGAGGNLTIDAYRDITGRGFGIAASNIGSGELRITTRGTVTSDLLDGLHVVGTGTDLGITAFQNISGYQDGIDALSLGSGATGITVSGSVVGTTGDGINIANSSSSNGDQVLAVGDVRGQNYGVKARNFGSGALNITTRSVTSTNRDGIYAYNFNNATDLTITAQGAVSGGDSAITARNHGSGALSITSSGVLTGIDSYGLFLRNSPNGTDLTVNAAGVSGGVMGIYAIQQGSGDVSVTTSGPVTGISSIGMVVLGRSYSSGGINIDAQGDVSGQKNGIFVESIGTGDVIISTSGKVTGGDANGIGVAVGGTADISITVSGAVTGGNYHGFYIRQVGTGSTSLTLNSGASVSATSGVAIADYYGTGDITVTVNQGASVTGEIILGDGDDTLIFDGGDFSEVTLFDGDNFDVDAGAGSGFDSITLRGRGVVDTGLLVNWEEVNLEGGYRLVGDKFDFGNLTVNGGGVIDGGNSFIFTGDLTIGSGGTLDAGSAFQIIGDLFLNAGGTLDSTGNSPSNTVITGNFANSGLVTLTDAETNDTVTVTGNYTSAGGTLELDTLLDDGLVDTTDKLIINGASAGATRVIVNNAGGAGGDTDTGNPTTDGIQIVQVDGASAGIFTLAAPVTAGAFAYSLVQADGQNWYLQSSGLIDQLFGYSALATAIADQLEPLRQRDHRGQLVSADGSASNSDSGFWSRVSYSNTEADSSNSVGSLKVDSELEYDRTKVQLGYDQLLTRSIEGSLIASVFGHYQRIDLDVEDSLTGAKLAAGEADGWGAGAALTWYGSEGWYGDLQMQFTRYNIDVDGVSGSDADTDAINWSVSGEAGHEIALSDQLRITPQAQLLWQQTDFDKLTDSAGVTAKWQHRDAVTVRAGLTLERDFMVSPAPITGYVVVDVVQALTDASEVEVNGVEVQAQLNRTRADLRIGAQHISADKKLVIYAEVGASESLNSRHYQRIDATAGLRWRFM